jgi:hypothetical protein
LRRVTAALRLDRMRSDENYIIDLCDAVLKEKACRQYRFEFLKGDTGRLLPVDAYYCELGIVVEFHEKQHNEPVMFFDRKFTVSGVSRREQRKIYDQRRRDILPKHEIALVEFCVHEFPHDSQKRLLRKSEEDKKIILERLKDYVKA